MQAGAEEGISSADFWRMTPREFAAVMKGRAQGHRQRLAEGLHLAWHMAAWNRQDPKKKLPELEPIIRKVLRIRRKEQTPEEALAIAVKLNAMMGGRDRRAETPRKEKKR